MDCKIRPLKQTGPQCGIAVITMILNLIDKSITQKDVLNVAITKGISLKGELFDCCYVAEILNDFGLIGARIGNWNESETLLLGDLRNSKVALVPYDCGPDFRPALKNGSRAHWACVYQCIDQGERKVLAFQPKSLRVQEWL
ncbi:hypothetical protein ACOME3_007632 [Neoechinorhynchus agilis]